MKTLALLARHRTALLASVRRRVRPPVEPADIVQEAFVRAIPAIEAGRVIDVHAFVHGIARNLSAEAMRQQQRWSRWLIDADHTDHIADDAPSPEAHAAGRSELDRLHGAMATLPPRCREIFAMRHVELLEKAEIANRLGIHVKQVEKQLRHALMLCARILGEQGQVDYNANAGLQIATNSDNPYEAAEPRRLDRGQDEVSDVD